MKYIAMIIALALISGCEESSETNITTGDNSPVIIGNEDVSWDDMTEEESEPVYTDEVVYTDDEGD
jgi:hypothetical protein